MVADVSPAPTSPTVRVPRGKWIWALSMGMFLTSGALWVLVPPSLSPQVPGWPTPHVFLWLSAGFALTEILVVHTQYKRETHTFSLIELPLVLGLVFAPPWTTLVALLLGGGLTLAVHRRQPPIKLAFNLGVYAMTATVAVEVFFALSPEPPFFGQSVIIVAAVAAMTASLLGIVLVFVAISISEGTARPSELRDSLKFGLVTSGFSAGLGSLAAALFVMFPTAAWMVILPAVGLHVACGAYTSERRRHDDLDFLFSATRLLHESSELSAAVVAVLGQARDAFRCDVAEILIKPRDDEAMERAVLGPGGRVEVFNSLEDLGGDDVTGRWWDHITGIGAALLVAGETSAPAADAYLQARGLREAVVATLTRSGEVVGVLTLADPLSGVTGFRSEDLRLAETLANHVSIAIDNGHLEQSLEQLRELERTLQHQANHDSLTGLANREMFAGAVTQALLEPRQVAVLFMDLDDFKTVNDTLGHAVGDRLLVEVARSVQQSLRRGDLAARLGGDEFAILLTGPDVPAGAAMTAERIVQELMRPISIGSHQIPVHASIGLAFSHGSGGVDDLLREADTAMYTAKARGKRRVEIFNVAMHDEIVSRYAAMFDIQRAIEEDQFEVHLQPIIDLRDQRLWGAEALVRWQHPTLGLVQPSEFIAVSEASGVVSAIDQLVLEKACRWLKHRDAVAPDQELIVTVNLATSDLLMGDLPALVSTTLRDHDLAPSRLVLEVTESLAIDNLGAAIDMLGRLKDTGVSIALDDFGTGFSSLSQLRDLPVDIVKIAKEFMDPLTTSIGQGAFVHAILKLAQILGKQTVAEGIERQEQADVLLELECDSGQGYYFSRPMDPERFDDWLLGWSGSVRRTANSSNVLTLPHLDQRPARESAAVEPSRGGSGTLTATRTRRPTRAVVGLPGHGR